MRFFNTAGPVRREDHYHIPPLERIDLHAVLGRGRGKSKVFRRTPPAEDAPVTVWGM